MKNPFKPGSSLWRYFGSLSAENRALIFERFCWLERMKSSESEAVSIFPHLHCLTASLRGEIIWVSSRNEAFNFSGSEPRFLGMWEPESKRIFREVTGTTEGAEEEKKAEEETRHKKRTIEEVEDVVYLGTVKAPLKEVGKEVLVYC